MTKMAIPELACEMYNVHIVFWLSRTFVYALNYGIKLLEHAMKVVERIFLAQNPAAD